MHEIYTRVHLLFVFVTRRTKKIQSFVSRIIMRITAAEYRRKLRREAIERQSVRRASMRSRFARSYVYTGKINAPICNLLITQGHVSPFREIVIFPPNCQAQRDRHRSHTRWITRCDLKRESFGHAVCLPKRCVHASQTAASVRIVVPLGRVSHV